MVKKTQETKEKKAMKASATSKKDKKKWTEGKKKDEVRRIVTVSEELLSKVKKDLRAPIITRYTIATKYNLNLGVAENILRYFSNEGLITKARGNSRMSIYCGAKDVHEVAPQETTQQEGVTVHQE